MEQRTYTKKEIAMAYFPELGYRGAIKHLMSWINENKTLYDNLHLIGYTDNQRVLTARQANAIFEAIGKPDGLD